MNIIQTKIIQFLVSKIGGAIVPVIAGGVALGVTKLTTFSPDLAAQINQPALVSFIWMLLMVVVNVITSHYSTTWVKVLQASLVRVGAKLDVDGWMGDETVKALEIQTGLPVRRAEILK